MPCCDPNCRRDLEALSGQQMRSHHRPAATMLRPAIRCDAAWHEVYHARSHVESNKMQSVQGRRSRRSPARDARYSSGATSTNTWSYCGSRWTYAVGNSWRCHPAKPLMPISGRFCSGLARLSPELCLFSGWPAPPAQPLESGSAALAAHDLIRMSHIRPHLAASPCNRLSICGSSSLRSGQQWRATEGRLFARRFSQHMFSSIMRAGCCL